MTMKIFYLLLKASNSNGVSKLPNIKIVIREALIFHFDLQHKPTVNVWVWTGTHLRRLWPRIWVYDCTYSIMFFIVLVLICESCFFSSLGQSCLLEEPYKYPWLDLAHTHLHTLTHIERRESPKDSIWFCFAPSIIGPYCNQYHYSGPMNV